MIMITVRIVSCEPSCAAKWHSSPGPRPSEMPAERQRLDLNVHTETRCSGKVFSRINTFLVETRSNAVEI